MCLTTKYVFENCKGSNCPVVLLAAALLSNNKLVNYKLFIFLFSAPCVCNSYRSGEVMQSVGRGLCDCLLTGPHA